MKNLSVLLLLLFSVCLIPAAADTQNIPQWEEFCPAEYKDAGSATFNLNKNYWHNRKMQFENSVNECSKKPDSERTECYQQVRELENMKNEILDDRKSHEVPVIRSKEVDFPEFGYAVETVINTSSTPIPADKEEVREK